MDRTIKIYRSNVYIASQIITFEKDTEKQRTEEKFRNIFVKIVKGILLLMMAFIECKTFCPVFDWEFSHAVA